MEKLMADVDKRMNRFYDWLETRDFTITDQDRNALRRVEEEVAKLRQEAVKARIVHLSRLLEEVKEFLTCQVGEEYGGLPVTKRDLQLARTEKERLLDMMIGLRSVVVELGAKDE